MASIVVDLLMRTGSFETDSRRAEQRLQQFGKTARTAALAIGAAAAAAGTAMAVMARRTIDEMDKVGQMAQQIGTTTEALTGLRYAAEQMASVNNGTFDMAMRRMTRRIAEAAQGSGAAKGALDELGLSAAELSRLPVDQQLLRIADAMRGATTQADRLRYTMAIFDTEGMPLVNMLNQGSDAIQLMTERARELGIVIEDETARRANAFNRTLSDMAAVKQGIITQVTAAMLPAFQDLADQFVDVASDAKTLEGAADALVGALKTLLSAGVAVAGTFDVVAEAVTTAASALYLVTQREFKAAAASLTMGWDNITSKFDSYVSHIKRMWSDTQSAMAAPITMPEVIVPGTRPTSGGSGGRRASSPPGSSSDPLGDFMREQQRLYEEYERFINQITGRTDRARLEQQTKWLEHAREVGLINAREFDDAITKLFPIAEEAMDEMTVWADQASRNIQDSLGETLRLTLEGDFKGIARAWLLMVQQMATEAAAAQLGQKLLGSGPGSGGGLLGSLFSSALGAFAGGPSTGVGRGVSFSSGPLKGTGVWAEGGFTGPGGKHEVAGLVHRGEYVINADATRRLPRSFLDRLNGYAAGGYVGAPPGGAGGARENLTIINQTTGRIDRVEERQLSVTERALIIQEAVETAWAQPNDPNSRASSVLKRNYKLERVR